MTARSMTTKFPSEIKPRPGGSPPGLLLLWALSKSLQAGKPGFQLRCQIPGGSRGTDKGRRSRAAPVSVSGEPQGGFLDRLLAIQHNPSAFLNNTKTGEMPKRWPESGTPDDGICRRRRTVRPDNPALRHPVERADSVEHITRPRFLHRGDHDDIPDTADRRFTRPRLQPSGRPLEQDASIDFVVKK